MPSTCFCVINWLGTVGNRVRSNFYHLTSSSLALNLTVFLSIQWTWLEGVTWTCPTSNCSKSSEPEVKHRLCCTFLLCLPFNALIDFCSFNVSVFLKCQSYTGLKLTGSLKWSSYFPAEPYSFIKSKRTIQRLFASNYRVLLCSSE